MSYSNPANDRRRRVGNSGGYGASGNRSAFGYWVPLVLTVSAAAVGIAAWVWSERRDDEEDTSADEHYTGGIPPPEYASMSGGLPPGPGPTGFQGQSGPMPGPPTQGGFQGPPPTAGFPGEPGGIGFQGGPPPGGYQEMRDVGTARSTGAEPQDESGLVARVSSALGFGRSASPAQSYDWASKKVAAGVAAAGAMVGGAINSLRDGGDKDYEDHERWSEEADQRESGREIKQGIKRQGTADEFFSGAVEIPKQSSLAGKKRKSIAVVVSSVEHTDNDAGLGQHASILAHLPEHINPDTTRVFVLIYAPDLKTHPLSPVATRRQSQSMASSFSNISHTDAHTPVHTPGEFPTSGEGGILANVEPNPIDEVSSLYKTLHNQAEAIVEKDNMILPFISKNGHKHILKSLSPEIVYIQESLCGPDGEVVNELSGWVRQTVVVIGDEGGHGGLVDTDDESSSKPRESWWQREERTGLGKRVSVVESLKIGDDWNRRVNEHD